MGSPPVTRIPSSVSTRPPSSSHHSQNACMYGLSSSLFAILYAHGAVLVKCSLLSDLRFSYGPLSFISFTHLVLKVGPQ